jgi:hypothetical protein
MCIFLIKCIRPLLYHIQAGVCFLTDCCLALQFSYKYDVNVRFGNSSMERRRYASFVFGISEVISIKFSTRVSILKAVGLISVRSRWMTCSPNLQKCSKLKSVTIIKNRITYKGLKNRGVRKWRG